MTALKKEELEAKEAEYGLSPDGLTYQLRCSRIAAFERGEEWEKPKKKRKKMWSSDPQDNPLYGKRLLISPMMRPDSKRNLAYREKIGHEIVTEDQNAGELIHGGSEDLQRAVGDYKIVHEDKDVPMYATTTFPKINTEITYTIGEDLVPVVRGNDHQSGYIWSFPTMTLPVKLDDGREYAVQVYGLKTIVQHLFPELLMKFRGKPMMKYIDGVTLAADIPQTKALLAEHKRKALLDARAGLV